MVTIKKYEKIFFFLIILLILFQSTLFAEVIHDSKFELGTRCYFFPIESVESDYAIYGFFAAEYLLKTKVDMDIVAEGEFYYDVYNDESDELLINNLYLDYPSSSNIFNFKVGYQTFAWNTLTFHSPVDFINQRNYEVNPFSPIKYSELAFLLTSRLKEKTALLEFYYLPFFTDISLPEKDSRFDLFSSKNIILDNNNLFVDIDEDKNDQFAFRLKDFYLNNWEAELILFYGYKRFPLFYENIDTSGNKRISSFYPNIYSGGFTFQGYWGEAIVRGEGIYTKLKKDTYTQANKKVDDYVNYGLEIEYTLPFCLNYKDEISFIVEILGDTDLNEDIDELGYIKFNRSNIFGSLKYACGNITRRAVKLGFNYDYLSDDLSLNCFYEETFKDKISLKVEYLNFLNTKSDFFNKYKKDDYVALKLSYIF